MKYHILASLIDGLLISSSFKPADGGYKPGDTARDFSLKNVDGKMYSLSAHKNAKGYIVIFTCNHCPFAQAYEDRIIALHNKYVSMGYPVIAINANDAQRQPEDSYGKMVERAKDKQYPFVYLHDASQEVARTYGAMRTPHVFLLDKSLKVHYTGAIDDNHEEPAEVKEKYLENALEALMKGRAVEKTETKAIGCGIKWKL